MNNTFIHKLGFIIPNCDIKYNIKKIITYENRISLVTKQNELIIFDYLNSSLNKKFIFLTNIQNREEIYKVFTIHKPNTIIERGNILKLSFIIITNTFKLYFCDYFSGRCYSKINLYKNFKNETVKHVSLYRNRFIIFLLSKRFLIFDSFSQMICFEQNYQFEDKNQYIKDTSISLCFETKKCRFFLISELKREYFLLIDFSKFDLHNENLNYEDYDYDSISFNFYKTTFNINNKLKYFSDEFIYYYSSLFESFIFTENGNINFSVLDSIDDISILNKKTLTYSNIKSPLIFIGELEIEGKLLICLVYKNLHIDIFDYIKKTQELKLIKQYSLLTDNNGFQFKIITMINKLLIYYIDNIYIYEFKIDEMNYEEDQFEDDYFQKRRIKIEERVWDNFLDINNFMDKKLYFSNYFKENFEDFKINILKELNSVRIDDATGSITNINESILPKNDNSFRIKSISKDVPIKKNLTISNLPYLTSNSSKFKISCSNLFVNKKDFSIYYIIGLNDGSVYIFETFLLEDLQIQPVLKLKAHESKITYMDVYNNRTLITASDDGLITFTDISEKGINIYLKNKSNTQEKNNLNLLSTPIKENPRQETNNFILIEPYFQFRSFYKLKSIMPVVQLDNINIIDNDNIKKRFNNNLAFIFDNFSLKLINMDSNQTIFNFNSNTKDIKGIYMKIQSNSLLILLENFWLKICSLSSRSVERVINNLEEVYYILKADDKFRVYFADQYKILINDFDMIYKNEEQASNKQDIKNSKDGNKKFDYEYESIQDKKLLTDMSNDKFSLNEINKKIKKSLKTINQSDGNDDLENINKIKNIFLNQFQYFLFQRKKNYLNITNNKFDALWIKSFEDYIIDDILNIVYDESLDEKLKKLKILNIINYPHKIFPLSKEKSQTTGIEVYNIILGNQLIQSIQFDFIELFFNIEKIVSDLKSTKSFLKIKHKFFNILSLCRIWGFSLEQDLMISKIFKIFSPIFEFFLILQGVDSSCTILINEEGLYNGTNLFKTHFKYLFETYINIPEEKRTEIKNKNSFDDKKYLITNECGYLTNLKFFTQSNDASHLINMLYFGSLLSILGYDDGMNISKFVTNDKLYLRILSNQNLIKFSNLQSQSLQIFDLCENLSLTSKDIIMIDYLIWKKTEEKRASFQIDVINKGKSELFLEFDLKINRLSKYIEDLHYLIFRKQTEISSSSEKISNYFSSENLKDLINEKYLTELDLFNIYTLIIINSMSPGKISNNTIEKTCEIMILYVFKIFKNQELKNKYCKVIIEMISKSSSALEKIFKENSIHFVKILVGLYTSIKIPIDLNGIYKKYDIGNCSIIKSEDNLNFLKIMIAKIIKSYSKSKINLILKYIIEEFKNKTETPDSYNYMMEIIWLLFKDKNYKHVPILHNLIGLLMTTMSPLQKDLRLVCLENCKSILSILLLYYPMISFQQNSQRLAVGSSDGKVFLYDVTTGSIWKNLNAHGNEISALIFDQSGEILITYSAVEGSLKFWKIGLKGFLTSIFGMKDGYYKIKKYEICENISPDNRLNNIKLQIMPNNSSKIMIVREDQSTDVLSLS